MKVLIREASFMEVLIRERLPLWRSRLERLPYGGPD